MAMCKAICVRQEWGNLGYPIPSKSQINTCLQPQHHAETERSEG